MATEQLGWADKSEDDAKRMTKIKKLSVWSQLGIVCVCIAVGCSCLRPCGFCSDAFPGFRV